MTAPILAAVALMWACWRFDDAVTTGAQAFRRMARRCGRAGR